jgi:hypothetical protein
VTSILYVYAVTRDPVTPDCEAVDQSRRFATVSEGGIAATFTPVDAEEFSQEVIDQRSADLEWLGAIGYRHQEIVAALMKETTVVPLRAFSLFSSAEAVRSFLHDKREELSKTLERLDGKREWTLRIELEPQRWSEALNRRVASLHELQQEMDAATPGRAFLLKKKLEEERKGASRNAEADLVAEIESSVLETLRCEVIAESRERRGGAFPQLNVLIDRDEEATLQELHATINARYEPDGVSLALSGPWPPYSFAGR